MLSSAKSAIDHSGRFSEMRATRSFGRMPLAANPSARCLTRPTNSADEMRTHSFPRFSPTVSGLLCRAIASRHIAARVFEPPELFSSGETFAALAEDTFLPISFEGSVVEFSLGIQEGRAGDRLHPPL